MAEETLGNGHFGTLLGDQCPRGEIKGKASTPQDREHGEGDPYVGDRNGEVGCEPCGDTAQHPFIDSAMGARIRLHPSGSLCFS